MWQDFAEYILNEVGDEDVKIAEIGIGKFNMIAKTISARENITLIKTDILPADESVIRDENETEKFQQGKLLHFKVIT